MTPTFSNALRLAHEAAMAGHPAPSAVMARMLMHVPVWDDGLLGADDAQAAEICRRCKISPEQYGEAVWNPGVWPIQQSIAA